MLIRLNDVCICFAEVHYRVKVFVSNSNESLIHGGEVGQLLFTMHRMTDGKGQNSGKLSFDNRYHAPGGDYESVIAGDMISHLKGVEVEWQYQSSLINPLTWRIYNAPKLHISKVVVDVLENSQK